MDVVKPRAVVDALAGVRITTPDKLVEERVALRPVRDAGNARVLPRDADAGVPHHEYQEPRLTVGARPKRGLEILAVLALPVFPILKTLETVSNEAGLL
jgi:hypothetical protein